MKRVQISDKWARQYHETETELFQNGIYRSPLTFCGVLEEFYKTIAKGWNNATRTKYDKDYNNVILPRIDNHNQKIISDYKKEDCEAVLLRIQNDGYYSKGEKQQYSESQMNHYKYLIYSVIQQAVIAGYCQDFLWGTKFEITIDREALAIKSKTIIKKSLSIQQEKRLVSRIMETPREDGKSVALLLMFSLGLRDGEACGLDFGDIYELPYYSGCYVAIVKQSTIPNSSILQSSGKTWNSGRRIPIPGKVVEFLLERKRIIKGIVALKELQCDVDRLPVAGLGYLDENIGELGIRLRADYVTEEARNVFKDVGIASEVLASLEIEMEEESARLEVTESNVTAYLLRRNFATHLKILGLDYPDIQYLLGHCIEDPYVSRPDYTDSKLYMLSQKMANRPLLNKMTEDRMPVDLNREYYFSGKEILDINVNDDIIKARIYAVEKEDSLTVKDISETNDISLQFYEEYKAYDPHRIIDIIRKYVSDYE